MDWLVLAVQGTLKSLLQHHSSKASILWHSAFFTVQLSHPYLATGKTIALTRRTFVGKVTSLLLNMLSRLVITFLPRSKRLFISWLQSPSASRITADDEIWLSPKLELDGKPEQILSACFWYHQWLDGWELFLCLEECEWQAPRYVHHFAWTLALIASWLDCHCRLLHKVFVSS